MTERRTELIGVRFTETEKPLIKRIADNRKIPITEFVREAIFSHINNLRDEIPLEMHFFMNKFKNILNSTENIVACIKDMKREFNLFDLERIKEKLRIDGLVVTTNQSKANFTIKNKSNL